MCMDTVQKYAKIDLCYENTVFTSPPMTPYIIRGSQQSTQSVHAEDGGKSSKFVTDRIKIRC